MQRNFESICGNSHEPFLLYPATFEQGSLGDPTMFQRTCKSRLVRGAMHTTNSSGRGTDAGRRLLLNGFQISGSRLHKIALWRSWAVNYKHINSSRMLRLRTCYPFALQASERVPTVTLTLSDGSNSAHLIVKTFATAVSGR